MSWPVMHKIKNPKDLLHINKSSKIRWRDIKDFQFEDDDILHIGYDEGFVSENESWDAHYFAIVTREIEETDEEFKNRMDLNKMQQEIMRKKRYETYLKYKEEFEPK
jgi:hypothetical protein